MSPDQLRGAVILLLLATFLYGVRSASQHNSVKNLSMTHPDKKGEIIITEIEGSKGHNGIYYLSPGSTVYDLFIVAEIEHIRRFERRALSIDVHNGDKIVITRDDKRYSSITVDRMEGATRYILDMQIDINSATIEELELIPGIGEETAREIVKYRETNGMFTSLDDVPCSFGKKKSDYLAKYFYIDERS